MNKKSSGKAKPKVRKVRSNSYRLETEWNSLPGDLNGCVLVLPELIRRNERMALFQGRLPENQL